MVIGRSGLLGVLVALPVAVDQKDDIEHVLIQRLLLVDYRALEMMKIIQIVFCRKIVQVEWKNFQCNNNKTNEKRLSKTIKLK